MEPKLEEIRNQQKATWDKFSPGWRKWDEFTMNFLKPMGDAIIQHINVKPTDTVLDVATGTGEPGLTIAAKVPQGKVTGQDLSDGMLQVAREHASQKGLKNYDTVSCDISELPFPSATFDAVSCRMGFMFFPDMEKAANEMVRVLKPGGRLATSVWAGPANNFWITAMMGAIGKNMELPPPAPGAPGMFRCAQPGLIADLLKKAGLKNVTEQDVSSQVAYDGIDHYWTMMNEVAAPVVAAMSKATEETKMKIKADLTASLKDRIKTNGLEMPYSSIIIMGEK